MNTPSKPLPAVLDCVLSMRWGDMDAIGHVNNTVYFRYMEQARFVWFEAMGWLARDDGFGPILAHVSCDFIKPLVYPGDVLVRQTNIRLGRSSVEQTAEIFRTDEPGVLYARGRSIVVWTDIKAGKSVPWPEDQRALFSVS